MSIELRKLYGISKKRWTELLKQEKIAGNRISAPIILPKWKDMPETKNLKIWLQKHEDNSWYGKELTEHLVLNKVKKLEKQKESPEVNKCIHIDCNKKIWKGNYYCKEHSCEQCVE